jgi:osmoprotectant transport system permease protein
VAAGGGTSVSNAFTWLNDPANWRDQIGTAGIVTQLVNHLEYSAIALGIGAVIALPIGLAVGHTQRGRPLVSVANGLRALPTTGLLILFYVLISPHISGRGNAPYLIPTEIVLTLLAIPPILANTFAGVDGVDPDVRDAARGMGMIGRQVLFRVEVPNALPLIFSGVRSATLQVIATATVAAYVGLGGLGRFLYDGLASHDFGQMTGGAVLVAVLALVADLLIAAVQRYAVSRGVSGRFRRRLAPDSRTGRVMESEAAPA